MAVDENDARQLAPHALTPMNDDIGITLSLIALPISDAELGPLRRSTSRKSSSDVL